MARGFSLGHSRGFEQSDGLVESGGHYLETRQRLIEVQMKFGRHPPHLLLELPNRLSAAASTAKDLDVVSISLRVIAQDQTQERRFARAIGSKQRPTFPAVDHPVDIAQDRRGAVANGHLP